jgi:transmembrane sensor
MTHSDPGAEEMDRIDAEARRRVLDAATRPSEAEAGWRAADPRHEAAYREASAAWDAVGRTRAATDGAWRGEAARLQRRARLRRVVLPSSLAAGLVGVVMLGGSVLMSGGGDRIATVTGQTRTLALADGSQVFVGARSAVKVRVGDRGRAVDLEQGEAFFEVAKDPRRPFYVHAGKTTILVVGTKFDVVRVGDDVRVSVLEGRVEVTRRQGLPGGGARELITGGQEVRATGGSDKALRVAAVGVAEPGAWRAGRLLYADAPLKEVVADANRYSAVPIRLASAEVGEMRVTATFRTGSVPDMIANLGQALPVKSSRGEDGAIVLSRDPLR